MVRGVTLSKNNWLGVCLREGARLWLDLARRQKGRAGIRSPEAVGRKLRLGLLRRVVVRGWIRVEQGQVRSVQDWPFDGFE